MKQPKPRVIPEPTEEQKAESRAAAEATRQDFAQRRAANREASIPSLQAGPALRDVQAAADCHCGCHPRVNIHLHAGGSECMCQDTTPELKAARKVEREEALTSLRAIWDNPEHQEREAANKAAVEATAARLEVDLHSWGGMAPFQIEGVVDGLSFYVRERHESYRIDVAPPEYPMQMVDKAVRLGHGEITIESGDAEDLYDGPSEHGDANAVENVARSIRDYQRRTGCSHILTNEKGSIQFRFCPICGVRAEEITGFVQ